MNKPRISIIVAMDEKRGIGKGNDLLFKIPEDFKRMKELTSGHPIIMGRKTFESIGRVLPNRTNIIVTRDEAYEVEGAVVVHSLDAGLEVAKEQEVDQLSLRGEQRRSQRSPNGDNLLKDRHASLAMTNDGEIFIFGGGQVFKEALEKGLVDRLYLTIVQGDYGADTFFQEYSEFTNVLKREEGTSGEYSYTFLDLEK